MLEKLYYLVYPGFPKKKGFGHFFRKVFDTVV